MRDNLVASTKEQLARLAQYYALALLATSPDGAGTRSGRSLLQDMPGPANARGVERMFAGIRDARRLRERTTDRKLFSFLCLLLSGEPGPNHA